MKDRSPCPCGSNNTYTECCQKAHSNINTVKTAEALMRSRYSAFVMANGDFLLQSYHSKTRPSKREMKATVAWTKSVQWIKLDVLKNSQGSAIDTEGMVEFKAYFMEQGKPNVIHENSRFTKENGHWVYWDGVHS